MSLHKRLHTHPLNHSADHSPAKAKAHASHIDNDFKRESEAHASTKSKPHSTIDSDLNKIEKIPSLISLSSKTSPSCNVLVESVKHIDKKDRKRSKSKEKSSKPHSSSHKTVHESSH